MPEPHIGVKSQINWVDVTMLSQKKTVLGNKGEMSDWWFLLAELCV